jgi:DNA-binding response OmpR family regulator
VALKTISADDTKIISARILIVDDDSDITLTFKSGLEKNDFSVTVFNDPLEALTKFAAGLYDLALLDVRMPKMNGFELYRELQMIDSNLKVCFVTAFVVYYESLREIYPNTKISTFIKKPIEIDRLVDTIINELK